MGRLGRQSVIFEHCRVKYDMCITAANSDSLAGLEDGFKPIHLNTSLTVTPYGETNSFAPCTNLFCQSTLKKML